MAAPRQGRRPYNAAMRKLRAGLGALLFFVASIEPAGAESARVSHGRGGAVAAEEENAARAHRHPPAGRHATTRRCRGARPVIAGRPATSAVAVSGSPATVGPRSRQKPRTPAGSLRPPPSGRQGASSSPWVRYLVPKVAGQSRPPYLGAAPWAAVWHESPRLVGFVMTARSHLDAATRSAFPRSRNRADVLPAARRRCLVPFPPGSAGLKIRDRGERVLPRTRARSSEEATAAGDLPRGISRYEASPVHSSGSKPRFDHAGAPFPGSRGDGASPSLERQFACRCHWHLMRRSACVQTQPLPRGSSFAQPAGAHRLARLKKIAASIDPNRATPTDSAARLDTEK